MRKLLYIIIGVMLLSCSERKEYIEAYNHAYALLDENPDSALQTLDHLTANEQDFSKSFRMKWQLLKFQALNKVDAPMDTISDLPSVNEYYDTHGTHHDKMISN